MANESTAQGGAATADPAAGAGSGGAAAVTPGTQAATSGTPGQAAATTASQTGFTYQEDRSKWIPPHRLTETSNKVRELESAIAESNRKVAALSGVQTPNADEARAAQIKEAFFKLPGMGVMAKLANLSEEQVDRMLAAVDGVDSIKQGEMRQWQRHGNEQMEYISSGVADAYGSENLDKDQVEDLRTTFSTWLKRTVESEIEASGGEKSPTLERYEQGDKKLLDQFVSGYTKRWVEPARRTAAARTSTRTRPVPNSAGRSQVTSVQRPEKFKSLDERLDYAVSRAKEIGVQFGR